MKGFSLTFILLLNAVSAMAIDFAPQYADSVQDGFPVRRLYLRDKEQHIYLNIPKGWSVNGNSQRGTLTPPDLPQATVTLENSALSGRVAFDEKGLPTYRRAATALIPSGATEVQVSEKVGSLPINGWSSFEMMFTYQAFGQHFGKSVLFLNLDKENQIQVRIETRQEHFEKVYGQARGILSSWFAPPPDLEAALAKMAQH